MLIADLEKKIKYDVIEQKLYIRCSRIVHDSVFRLLLMEKKCDYIGLNTQFKEIIKLGSE